MLDILLFGASGLTGQYCIPYIYKITKDKGRNLKWGIAGRSEVKLKCALQKAEKKIGADLSSVPIVLADIHDYESLLNMAKKTKLLLNCCGPYRHTGESVIKACIEAGTHQLDISAELDYSEKLDLYHETAKEKGIYLLTACGFDSVIYEMGMVDLQQKFNGVLNSVEVFLNMSFTTERPGSDVNYATWSSVIDILSDYKQYNETRERATPKNLPKCFPVLKKKVLSYKSDKVNGYIVPLLTNDEFVMKKTQQYLYEVENKRPVQIATYLCQTSLIMLIASAIFSLFILIMVKFKITRQLLLDYPSLFTFGYVDKGTPSAVNVEKAKAVITFYGEGWKGKFPYKKEIFDKPIDRCILSRVSAYNPGYGASALLLVLAGILVLTEKDRLANNGKGGVYTPGVVFSKTSMIEELRENGVNIQIVYERDL